MSATHRVRIVALLLSFALGIFGGCGPAPNEYVAPPAPEVTVIRPLVHSLTRYLEENGETEPVERAVVRARVEGFIESIRFEPGQTVEKDDVIYEIEDEEYTAAEASASAELTASIASISVAQSGVLTAEAEVRRAANERQRQKSLLAQQATSQTEYDQAVASDEAAQANLAAARSQVEAAEAAKLRTEARLVDAQRDLSYTKVKAPITGRMTKTDIKLGNLVSIGERLSAVVDDRNIFVNFNVSDRQLLEFLKSDAANAEGKALGPDEWAQIEIEVQRELDEGFPFKGRLDYVDQEGVAGETGTLRIRGMIANPGGSLFPGLFVRVRLAISVDEDAILIPELAVSQDRIGKYVLVVGEDRKVGRRTIQTGQRIDGWIAVDNGLDAGNSIVVEGLQRARPGTEVSPIEMQLSEENTPRFGSPATMPISDRNMPANEEDLPDADGTSENS